MFKPYYIVPTSIIDPIYMLEQIACILLIVLIGLLAFLELNKKSKTVISIVSAIIIVVHYIILYKVSIFEKITILPLLFIEQNSHGSAFAIDYGQLLILMNLFFWRKEIRNKIFEKKVTYKNSSR
ncbi:MAG: hypothetical protein GXO43_02675 [Crenarchaeota archaeon]|nr:hypothetical protein [Thermoproteota archaeon]